jgi:hypothetical protein
MVESTAGISSLQCSESKSSMHADAISDEILEGVKRLGGTQRPVGCEIIHTEIVCQAPSFDLR